MPMRGDAFSRIHPAVELAFFLAVMLITAFVLHPVVTGISLIAACAYAVRLNGRRAILLALCGALPLMLFVAILNPLFNHAGTKVLFFLHNGNAVTLEAVIYGVVSAAMFAALLMWFSCLNRIMTSDKYVCLFGRVIPALSLLFSMALRFVPRFTGRIRQVLEAQRSLGPDLGKKPIPAIKRGLSALSVTTTWALESAVNVSDSMKSRGYGLPGRSSYSIYRFDGRDAVFSAVMLVCFGLSVAAMALKHISFRFYPSIKYPAVTAFSVVGCIAFFLLCTLPLWLDLMEDVKWRVISSKI